MNAVRRKKPLEKKKMVKIAVAAGIFLLAAVILLMMLRRKVTNTFGKKSEGEVEQVQVTKGNISTTISGAGNLSNEESEEISIPQSVEVNEIYVSTGDVVEKGDMLASVNSASVMAAMNDIQKEIDELDQELAKVEETEEEDTITAGVSGRVKKIYGKAGKNVSDIMYKKEALLLLSVDGYMAVDVETDALKKGDSVTVKVSAGTKYTGTVDSIWAGKATILITDNGTSYGDTVTVNLGDGTTKEGKLYIHECVKVTGYAGTISSVNVEENQSVSQGKTLFYLKNTSQETNYASLLEERETLEEQLQNLIVIYKEGAVYAQDAGMITSITEVEDSTVTTTTATAQGGFSSGNSAMTEVSSLEDGESQDTIIALAPTDQMLLKVTIDETDILSVSKGQEATITIESLGEENYTGTVTEIDKAGTDGDGTITYSATLSLERQEGMLEGMSASALITVEGKENTLLLPEKAVNKTSSSAYVYTSYDEDSGEFGDMVEVTVGISNGTYIEIMEGLQEGDSVYYREDEAENAFGTMQKDGSMPGGEMPGGGNMPGEGMPEGGNQFGGNGRGQDGNDEKSMPKGNESDRKSGN